MIDIIISSMTADDVDEAVQLDRENLSPWAASHFINQLPQKHSWQFVARSTESQALVGFICGQILADEGEIHKIAVANAFRRQHIGHRLLDHALAFLENSGSLSCFLELRASNQPAQLLYSSFAFRPCGLRKKYYNSPKEDAIIMRLQQQQSISAS
ncbi:MAG: ribosomal protein S18-alanine N-acetyltransferase [Thermodesulfobacteriota bacterium]